MKNRLRSLAAGFFLSVLPVPAATAPAVGEQVGKPETLGMGITETVDRIMERDRIARTLGGAPSREADDERLRTRPFKPADDPRAPAVSRWPIDEKNLAAVEQILGPQSVGTTFRAVSTATGESPYIPPDSMGDVGPTQILVHVNGRVKVFDKAGTVGPLNTDDATFWGAVRNGEGVTDPEVRYDRLSARWFLMAVNLADSDNRVMIAVSSGPTIAGPVSFTFYSFAISAGGGMGDTTNFCDYPSLGVDANALYIGCNMFDTNGFVRTTGFVVRKSSVLAGGPIVVTAFRGLGTELIAGLWAPRGVDNDDAGATQGYFIGADTVSFSRLQIRRVSTPGGTPTISANLPLNVPVTTLPIPQPTAGALPLDTSDDRLMMASIHKNKITGAITLRTAHNIEVNSACVGASGGGRNGARWYEIGNLTTTPTLVQSGTLCDGSASPAGYFFPTAIMTGQGHMVLASSVSMATQSPGVAVAGRLRSDTLGLTSAATVVQSGLAPYEIVVNSKNRWGDYSFADVDPLDDQTVWTIQEYADTPSSNWAIRAVQLKAPPPAMPASAVPSSVCVGVAATSVAITGTSTAGSEFFDPGPDSGGPGYAKHIGATVGNGASVSGTTFVDPTHLSLTLGTVGASTGPASVTITNPDGQVRTTSGLITLASTPAVVDSGVRVNRSGAAALITWNLASGATSSDVVRGLLGQLPVGPGGGDETCLADNAAATSLTDGVNPAVGTGFWYLVRGESVCGKGSYGRQGLNGGPGVPRSTSTCS